jgi:hypothetical protein
VSEQERKLADDQALDVIARWMQDPDWGVGMLEDICDVVARTGRDVEGDGQPTWDRH